MTTVRAAVCTGLNEPWKTEEIEIDPPGNREVRVKMVWSGMCHSDEHLRTGDISQTPEVLEMMGVKSMFPVVGGHEGSGIVTDVGTNVTQVAEVTTSLCRSYPPVGRVTGVPPDDRTSAISG
jgi:Zn-dependent alcohol dehydrogenase